MKRQNSYGLAGITLAFILMSGCATTGKYDTVLNSWLNHDVNELFQSWGPPSNEFRQPDGNTQYTWLLVGGTRIVSNYNTFLNATIYNANTYWCKTTFTVNSSNKIMGWRREGNACRSK